MCGQANLFISTALKECSTSNEQRTHYVAPTLCGVAAPSGQTRVAPAPTELRFPKDTKHVALLYSLVQPDIQLPENGWFLFLASVILRSSGLKPNFIKHNNHECGFHCYYLGACFSFSQICFSVLRRTDPLPHPSELLDTEVPKVKCIPLCAGISSSCQTHHQAADEVSTVSCSFTYGSSGHACGPKPPKLSKVLG